MGRPRTIETDAILRIAREVFLQEGAFGSTKEIAARAGISEAALFKRFPTKPTLFLAAMAPPPADTDFILARAREETDPRRALHVLAKQVLAHYRMAIPRMLHLITHPGIGLDALGRTLGPTQAVALDAALAAYLRDEHRKGRVYAPNAQASAALIVAALHSVVLFELMGVHGGEIPQSAVDAMIDASWQGLSPRKKLKSPKRSSK